MQTLLGRIVKVGLAAFALSALLNLISGLVVGRVGLVLAVAVVVFIVGIGVGFDIVGTAAAAASPRPFHAMAAKKVSGSRQALRVLRNADRVANFCNDMVGDIAGTVSGAVAASIVVRLARAFPRTAEAVWSCLVIGAVAFATVGGKAYSKRFALGKAESVVLAVGRLLAWLEGATGIVIPSEPGLREKGSKR